MCGTSVLGIIPSLRAFRRAELENDAKGKEERSYDLTKTLENRLDVYERMMAQDGSKRAQDGPKSWAQYGSQAPTWPKMGPKMAPRRPQGGSKSHLIVTFSYRSSLSSP